MTFRYGTTVLQALGAQPDATGSSEPDQGPVTTDATRGAGEGPAPENVAGPGDDGEASLGPAAHSIWVRAQFHDQRIPLGVLAPDCECRYCLITFREMQCHFLGGYGIEMRNEREQR